MNPMQPGVSAPPPPPPASAARPWYRMKRVWIGGVIALLVIGGAAGGSKKKDVALTVQKGTETAAPATQPTAAPTTATTAAPTTTAPKPTTTTTVKVTTTTTEKVDACEAVKEALLTGTQAQINAAMTALIADKTQDATAREYADNYMHRDAPPAYGSKDLRSMDVSLVRMSCS